MDVYLFIYSLYTINKDIYMCICVYVYMDVWIYGYMDI